MFFLEFLNVSHGDKKLEFKDEGPEDRAIVAKQILKLQKKGFALFLIKEDNETCRIKGYDKKRNQWILVSGECESAENSKVEAVSPQAGG